MYKLFVGGLPFAMSDEELNELFSEFGTVASAIVIRDRDTKRSKGYGFVEFESEEEGKKAESELNGKQIGTQTISVSQARPREERPRRDFNGGGNGGSFRQRSW